MNWIAILNFAYKREGIKVVFCLDSLLKYSCFFFGEIGVCERTRKFGVFK